MKRLEGLEYELVRHTALSRVLDIVTYAQKSRVGDAAKLAAAYATNLTFSDLSEKVTANLVSSALDIHAKLLTQGSCLQMLIGLDDQKMNPLDSVTKLHVIATKSGRKAEWLLAWA